MNRKAILMTLRKAMNGSAKKSAPAATAPPATMTPPRMGSVTPMTAVDQEFN